MAADQQDRLVFLEPGGSLVLPPARFSFNLSRNLQILPPAPDQGLCSPGHCVYGFYAHALSYPPTQMEKDQALGEVIIDDLQNQQ